MINSLIDFSLRNRVLVIAVYVALAETLGEPLFTRDKRLAAAAGHEAAIEVV